MVSQYNRVPVDKILTYINPEYILRGFEIRIPKDDEIL